MTRQSTLARFEVSGEILSEDTLALLAVPLCKLPGAEMSEPDFAAAYALLSEQWQKIRTDVASFNTTQLRDRWQKFVLELLDHDLVALGNRHTPYADNRTIPLTHTAGNVPIWMLDYGQSYDQKPETGKRRKSPHELFQEYLDSGAGPEWGILFNGKTIRLLHDYHKTLTRNYIEADLESLFDALDADAFRAVWRVFHAAQFKAAAKGICPLAKLHDVSRQEGAAIGKELYVQVRKAVERLGNGFLAADRNGELRAALTNDPEALPRMYQALLRVIYRLLFLLYIENRPAWTPAADPVWTDSYSVLRLRERCEERNAPRAEGEDNWEGVKVVSRIIGDGSDRFDIHAYGGEIFDDEMLWLLKDVPLKNADLLAALRLLTIFERDGQIQRVNFRYLDVTALGSVYENMLDLAPVLTSAGTFGFVASQGREGDAHYTPKELVAELIKSALVPVIEERLNAIPAPSDKAAPEEWQAYQQAQERALLSIKVIDPACGSGHFLVQALEELTAALVEIRLSGETPGDLDIRAARRDVVTSCIYGVDMNPLAVDLCRFVLWLNVAHPKFPLNYLEPLIKCGNSLVGVPIMSQVIAAKQRAIDAQKRLVAEHGVQAHALPKDAKKAYIAAAYVGYPECIPDEAFEAVGDDEKKVATELKQRNKTQRGGQLSFKIETVQNTTKALARAYDKVKQVGEYSRADVLRKNALYHEYLESPDYVRARAFADLWCAAFYWRLDADAADLTLHEWLRQAQDDPDALPDAVKAELTRIRKQVRPLHWELEFPDIFANGGFDCVLGNPPWARIKLKEETFFATRAPHIADAQNKAARQKMIVALEDDNPDLLEEFRYAQHAADAESKFMRRSGRFPLTAVGDINTYALFAETFRGLLHPKGRAGVVVPTGIATDDTTKMFFGDLTTSRSLAAFWGLDNEGKPPIFRGITDRMRFGLLIMSGNQSKVDDPQFTFSCSQAAWIHDPIRRFRLSTADFALLNPNTRTCPVFRTRPDAELTRALYSHVPVLINEVMQENQWGVKFMRMLDMANDSGLFLNDIQTHTLPLYEAKMIHQFDHRFGTFEGATQGNIEEGGLPQPTPAQKADPHFTVQPRYWVDQWDVLERVSQVPDPFVRMYRNRDEKNIRKMLVGWLAGYCLNRGDEGDTTRAAMGEWIVQKTTGSMFQSLYQDMIDYWTHEVGYRAVERRYPLTPADIETLRTHPEENYWFGVAAKLIEAHTPKWLLTFRGITSGNLERTATFSLLPCSGVGNGSPVMLFACPDASLVSCFIASANSIVFDYVLRHKIAGPNLNFFIVKQLAVLPPHAYTPDDVAYIAPRVLELVYTSWDMKPFAEDMGYHGAPCVWDEERRAIVRAELDAYFARMYGLTRKQLRYILDPYGLSDAELADIVDPWEEPTCSGPHLLPAEPTTTFPGETFRVLRQNEQKKYGEYRTRRLVLQAWAELEAEHGPAPIRNYRQIPDPAQVSDTNANVLPAASSDKPILSWNMGVKPRPLPSANPDAFELRLSEPLQGDLPLISQEN